MNNTGNALLGFQLPIVANSRLASSVNIGQLSTCRLILLLILVLALGACATHAPEVRDNGALRRTIHDGVPGAWRDALDSTEEVSPLLVSRELREFIHSTARSNATPRERILALSNAIVDADGVGLVYDANATYTASEAFRSRAGNCLGFSNLLVASARDLGLNASFELVSHGLRWEKIEGALVGTLHVRVATFVSGTKMVFDFYPLPLDSGYSTQLLSDNDALAHHLNNLAVQSMQDGNNEGAFSLLFKAIETSPSIAFIWSNLGVLLSRHDLNLLAEAAFDEALSISPETLSALSNLQRLYFEQGRHAEATALTEQLEEYRRRNPYYHFWLGEQAYEQGNFQEAVRHIKEAINLQKNKREFYVLLSKSYEELGLGRAALRASRKAETVGKTQAKVYSVKRPPPETGTRITRQ